MLAMMADNIEHVVSYWLLFQKFHSPALAGFAEISHWTPFLLLSVYFGGIADRYDCRKVIQIAQLLFMAVSATWAVLFFTNSVQVWHAGEKTLRSLGGPARVDGRPCGGLPRGPLCSER